MTRSWGVALLMAASALGVSATRQQMVFRGTVDSVELDVAVMSRNKAVAGLTVRDFELFDNNVKQTILEVTRETQPVDVTLLIDISGSVSDRLLRAILRGAERVRKDLRKDDRLALVSFNHRVREHLALQPADSVGRITVDRPTGMTAMYDAIALSLATAPPQGRRQMVLLFTDGVDTRSFLDEPAVLDVAGRSRAAVFVVAAGVAPSIPSAFFGRLTDATGGMVQVVPFMPVEVFVKLPSGTLRQEIDTDLLDGPFLRALDEFRTSYVLRYTLEGVKRAGWHDLVVRVAKPGTNYTVRARRGYIGG
jgi:Ca-activated chloride channel family protein